MRVHVLQHVPFEGLGSIESWLAEHGAEVTWTPFHTSAALPDVAALDLVIALGGPMSVNDESELPWLVDEKRFIAAAMDAGKAVLGICLGAQLIASARGAKVYPAPQKEIGWFDIAATGPHRGLFRFPDRATVFHWHGETFDLPPGAVLLARSAACTNQAFQLGPYVIGMQFHLETTPQSAEALIENCGDELVEGPFVQSEGELRARSAAAYEEVNALMSDVLGYLTRGLRRAAPQEADDVLEG